MQKLKTTPTIGRQVRAWLKSGMLDRGDWFPTNEGTPQGGVISHLLANIALHGLEEYIKQWAGTWKGLDFLPARKISPETNRTLRLD